MAQYPKKELHAQGQMPVEQPPPSRLMAQGCWQHMNFGASLRIGDVSKSARRVSSSHMYVRMHTDRYTYIRKCVYMYAFFFIYTCIGIYTHLYICVFMHIPLYIYIYTCKGMHVSAIPQKASTKSRGVNCTICFQRPNLKAHATWRNIPLHSVSYMFYGM